MHYIYRIINTVSGKVYIGQTNDIKLRWSQHKSSVKNGIDTMVITRAMMKYGIDSFKFDVIAATILKCTCLPDIPGPCQDDANMLEIACILQYDCLAENNKGYNVDRGGGVSPRSESTRKKISAARKGITQKNKGRPLTTEHKESISAASIGKAGTNTGKEFSEEWRANMSKSMSGGEHIAARRFNEEQEKEICRLYNEEERSMYWLGKEFKCQRTLIDDILTRRGVVKRQSSYTGHDNGRNIFSNEQELEICRIYKEERSSREKLAKMFNCGKTTIRNILMKHGELKRKQ